MQKRLQDIFDVLQAAKAEGVKETDLLDDYSGKIVSANNARVKRSRLNKLLGKGAVTTENGVWKLDKRFWDMKLTEFSDIILIYEIREVRKVVLYSVALAVIMSLALGIALGLAYEIELIYA